MTNSNAIADEQETSSSQIIRPNTPHKPALWLDRIILGWIFILVASAPHSIAATQISWGVGLFVCVIRYFVPPRPQLYRTPLDYPLLGFFALTVISSFLSYAPDISIGKLRAASLFTITYLIAQNVRQKRTAMLLAYLLIVSCSVNVFYTLGQRVWGRGVKVQGIKTESPFRASGIEESDTLLKVNGVSLRGIDVLESQLRGSTLDPPAQIHVYHYEAFLIVSVPRGKLLAGQTPEERLGISGWTRGRDWRAVGFYDHYTTYAEAMQLLASLVCGLFIAFIKNNSKRKFSRPFLLLAFLALCFCAALFLTFTRASWLSLLLSLCVMTLLSRERRLLFALALCVALVIPAGLVLLQSKRNLTFFDQKDPSISYRQTVWREGVQLLVANPGHLLTGVGMDSIKRYWRAWGLFDGGRLPVGHMHSTPLQIVLERGLPALFAWLALLFLYARMLFKLLWRQNNHALEWDERGVLLGAAGGLVGFVSSGMVHYNLGDSEVAMVFYLIMGLTLVLERELRGA